MAARRKPGSDRRLMRELNRNIAKLASRLEADNVAAFVALSQRPFRMMWLNLLAGLTRGVGMFLGATVMGGLLLALGAALVYYLLEVFEMIPFLNEVMGSVGEAIRGFIDRHRPAR